MMNEKFRGELDAVLARLIAANPGARPNDIASLALSEMGADEVPKAKVLVFAARRTIRDRAAELLGVEREPSVMNANEARLDAFIESGIARAVERARRRHDGKLPH